MDVKFGTSGLRGLATDLLAGAAQKHVAAFAAHLLAEGHCMPGNEVFIARDKRPSSPALLSQCASAIADAGLKPVDCSEIPTPALACHAFALNCAAVMITGSHIPADRNGIKFYLPGAEISKTDEQSISALAATLPLPEGHWQETGSGFAPAMSRWHQRHLGLLASNSLSGLKIGIHEHSSVATDFLAQLLVEFGAQVHRFGKTEQFTPVDTEAVDQEFVALYTRQAAEHGLAAIVTTDADGDRPMLADENGRPLPGDLLGWLTCQWIKADAVATPVTSNSAIRSSETWRVHRTRVGSPFVIAAMNEAKATGAKRIAGFEANGGFLLGSPVEINGMELSALPTRDSTLAILAALRLMKLENIAASDLSKFAGFRATASDRLQDYAPARSATLIGLLSNDPTFLSDFVETCGQVNTVDLTDGVRITLASDEIIHYRASGNAPEMRCYVEAASNAKARHLLEIGLRSLAEFDR